MKLENIIRNRLKTLRKTYGISQEKFAKIAGINYKYYQSVESGRRGAGMRINTLEKISRAYGVAPFKFINPSVIKTKLKRK